MAAAFDCVSPDIVLVIDVHPFISCLLPKHYTRMVQRTDTWMTDQMTWLTWLRPRIACPSWRFTTCLPRYVRSFACYTVAELPTSGHFVPNAAAYPHTLES